MAAQQNKTDSIKVDKLKVSEIYTVGLELDKAIANPGSDYDILLRDGDELIVPEKTTTVRVQGEVMYPNTVHYISGKPVGYYVRQAGGYSESSRRSKVYVLYMNGTVATGPSAKVEPGCEIIVPKKPERDKITASEIMSIGSSAASIAAVVATIVNLTRK
jgi:protein involved in polysaccharide export with SLBB domain